MNIRNPFTGSLNEGGLNKIDQGRFVDLGFKLLFIKLGIILHVSDHLLRSFLNAFKELVLRWTDLIDQFLILRFLDEGDLVFLCFEVKSDLRYLFIGRVDCTKYELVFNNRIKKEGNHLLKGEKLLQGVGKRFDIFLDLFNFFFCKTLGNGIEIPERVKRCYFSENNIMIIFKILDQDLGEISFDLVYIISFSVKRLFQSLSINYPFS